ncbi:hypothetical protein Tco_0824393 [Tanacetum coccineum]|uniref:Uncharacterized protein n=1 Tax=Tanacetum coccineum TaxID=301880 RepID=A0ABQ5AQ90_9ASTR
MLSSKGRKIPESPWGSPIPIEDGDGDVKRFSDGDGDGDGDEAHKRGWGWLMVSKYASLNEPYNARKSQNREVFSEIIRKELELNEQELSMREHKQRLKDELFHMQPNHLT